jgi:hypothetical protein
MLNVKNKKTGITMIKLIIKMKYVPEVYLTRKAPIRFPNI